MKRTQPTALAFVFAAFSLQALAQLPADQVREKEDLLRRFGPELHRSSEPTVLERFEPLDPARSPEPEVRQTLDCTANEGMTNGGFEFGSSPDFGCSGTSGAWRWTASDCTLPPIAQNTATTAFSRSGSWAAYFSPFANVQNTLYQQVTIPPGTTPLLTFYLAVGTFETTTLVSDIVTFDLRNTSGQVISSSIQYSNLDDNRLTYQKRSINLSNFVGQTIRINFTSRMDQTNSTIFLMDDFSLELTTCTQSYSLVVGTLGTGSGTVTSSPSGISCGSTCSASFSPGQSVVLTATPANGSSFGGWAGACSGTGSCTVTMSQPVSVLAEFTGGSTQRYGLTVEKSGTGSGNVSSSPSGIDCGSACSFGFSSGQSVALTATAAAGSAFSGWSGACSGTGSCTVTMSQPRNVSAQFAVGTASCTNSSTTLCLNNSRFKVEGTYTLQDGQGSGPIRFGAPLTGDSGYFYFNNASDAQGLVKVLNACTASLGNRYWVFIGALTDQGVALTVTDTKTGASPKTYTNPLKTVFAPVQDTSAFATCP